MIIYCLPPPDADAFCLLNKSVRSLAASFLEQHLSLKLKYTEYRSYSNCDGGWPIRSERSPASLLADILQNPKAAFYVRNLYLEGCEGYNEEFRDGNEAIGLFCNAVKDCAVFQSEKEKELWSWGIKCCDEQPIIAIFFLLLPSITRLDISDRYDSPWIDRVLRRILEARNTAALNRLSTIELDDPKQTGVDYGQTMILASLFPVINRLSARRMTAFNPSDCQDSSLRTTKSALLHINLAECEIEPPVLSRILNCTTSLNTFRYSSPYTALGPLWLCSSLKAHTQDTLAELILYSDEDRFLGSLKEFKVLKIVSTLVQHLHDPSIHSQPAIAQMLPPSLTTLKLRDDGSLGPLDHCKLLDDILQNKDQEVICLTKFSYIFEDDGKTTSDARETFKCYFERDYAKAGIELSLAWIPFTCFLHEDEVLQGAGWHQLV